MVEQLKKNSAKLVKGSATHVPDERDVVSLNMVGRGGRPEVGGGASHCSFHTVFVFLNNKNIQLKIC